MINEMNLSFAQILVRFDFSPACHDYVVFEKMISDPHAPWKIVGRMNQSNEYFK